MYNLLSKHGEKGAFLVGVVLVAIFIAIAFSGAGDYNFENMADSELFQVNIFNFGMIAAMALAAIAAVAMLGFGLWQVATNFKGSIAGIIGVLVILGLFFIYKGMSMGEITEHHPSIQGAIDRYLNASEGNEMTSGQLKFIGGFIRTGLTLGAVAFASLIIMPIVAPLINRVK